MAKKIDNITVGIDIKMKSKISFWQAFKLRLAGGEAIQKLVEKTVEKTEGLSHNLICGHDKVCEEIAENFGIKHCRWLQINMHVNEVVTVRAEFYPEIDGVKQLLPIFEEYKLVKKGDNA